MEAHDEIESPLGHATAEEFISLAAAAALIRIDGKRARPSTAFRWYQNGIGGRHNHSRIHLKALRLGGRVVTKTSWVREFLNAVSAAASAPPPTLVAPRTSTAGRNERQRRRGELEAAKKALAAGF